MAFIAKDGNVQFLELLYRELIESDSYFDNVNSNLTLPSLSNPEQIKYVKDRMTNMIINNGSATAKTALLKANNFIQEYQNNLVSDSLSAEDKALANKMMVFVKDLNSEYQTKSQMTSDQKAALIDQAKKDYESDKQAFNYSYNNNMSITESREALKAAQANIDKAATSMSTQELKKPTKTPKKSFWQKLNESKTVKVIVAGVLAITLSGALKQSHVDRDKSNEIAGQTVDTTNNDLTNTDTITNLGIQELNSIRNYGAIIDGNTWLDAYHLSNYDALMNNGYNYILGLQDYALNATDMTSNFIKYYEGVGNSLIYMAKDANVTEAPDLDGIFVQEAEKTAFQNATDLMFNTFRALENNDIETANIYGNQFKAIFSEDALYNNTNLSPEVKLALSELGAVYNARTTEQDYKGFTGSFTEEQTRKYFDSLAGCQTALINNNGQIVDQMDEYFVSVHGDATGFVAVATNRTDNSVAAVATKDILVTNINNKLGTGKTVAELADIKDEDAVTINGSTVTQNGKKVGTTNSQGAPTTNNSSNKVGTTEKEVTNTSGATGGAVVANESEAQKAADAIDKQKEADAAKVEAIEDAAEATKNQVIDTTFTDVNNDNHVKTEAPKVAAETGQTTLRVYNEDKTSYDLYDMNGNLLQSDVQVAKSK